MAMKTANSKVTRRLLGIMACFVMTVSGVHRQTAWGAEPLDDEAWVDAIRMAGFRCTELIAVQSIGENATMARVTCSNAAVYIVLIDERGETEVSPLSYIAPPDPNKPAPEACASPLTHCWHGVARQAQPARLYRPARLPLHGTRQVGLVSGPPLARRAAGRLAEPCRQGLEERESSSAHRLPDCASSSAQRSMAASSSTCCSVSSARIFSTRS